MFSKIELECDTSNLGGLYIAIIYNLYVLSLKIVVINSASKFLIIVFSYSQSIYTFWHKDKFVW
jgi:hypothetical protein